MGLTYAGGRVVLIYAYNGRDELGLQNNENENPPTYNNFTIELTKSNGVAYTEGTQKESLLRGFDSASWNINGNIVTNASDLTFPPKATSGTETITNFNLYLNTLSDGFIFATGTLNTPITIQKGETPIIRAYDANSGDGLEIDFDIANTYSDAFTRKINDYVFLAQDSLSSVSEYKFIPAVFGSTIFGDLSFFVAREDDPLLLNWGIANIVTPSSYAQAYNLKDLELPLNDTGSSAVFNRIYMYYSQGDFPNETYVFAGSFVTITDQSTGNPTNYTILNGETGRFKTLELRLNAR